MQTRIETSRLILRPFEQSDAQAAFQWFGDPVVMRFTLTGPDKSVEETITRLAGLSLHWLRLHCLWQRFCREGSGVNHVLAQAAVSLTHFAIAWWLRYPVFQMQLESKQL
jgi:RimJ/RimL family protein N-acetyltransferase